MSGLRSQQPTVASERLIPLAEPWFPPAYADAIRDQVLSSFIGPGPATKAFSEALAAFLGIPRCLLTTSGTMALSVAARALRLEPGDEVIVPAYAVIAVINAFASVGIRPRLVDIDRETGCLSPERLAESLRPKTKAVCFVNFSGYTGPNLPTIRRLCDEQGIPMIEDAACALGHCYQGQAAGTFGDVGTYSFSVPKVITTGQGGALVARNSAVFEHAAAFIDHGDPEWRKTNLNRKIGTNLRFNDILAAFGLCQIRDIEARLARRRLSYAALRARLGAFLYAVPGDQAPLHNIAFSPEPDRLVSALRAEGVLATRQYRTLSQHPPYAELAERPYPNSDYWTDRAVYLPFGMALTPDGAERIADAIEATGITLEQIQK